MQINILRLIEGAKQAKGLVVIIDVFRAFSLECYLYSMGAKLVRPVGTVEEARKLKDKHSEWLLVGERGGRICEGFDFGNSPSSITEEQICEKEIIHTTSAGTQGIVNAVNADKIIAGCLANAKAVAEYIRKENPKVVSLVCMGNAGRSIANEDELCARYIKSLLENEPLSDIDEQILRLKTNGAEHFFNKEMQEVFPEQDFWLCTKYDIFPFVLEIQKDELGYVSIKKEV